jgi:hypothetical protein
MAIGATPQLNQQPAPQPTRWQLLAARIPSTKQFQERKTQQIAGAQTNMLAKLHTTVSAGPPGTPVLRYSDEGMTNLFIAEAAKTEFWRSEFMIWTTWLIMTGTLGTMLLANLWAKHAWHIHQPWKVWGWSAGATVLAICVCVLYFFVVYALFNDFVEELLPWRAQATVMFTPFAALLLAALIGVHHLRVIAPHALSTFLFSVAIFELGLLLSSLIAWVLLANLLRAAVDRQAYENTPIGSLFTSLLGLFPLASWSFQYPYWISEFLNSLEHIAYLVEVPLAKSLRASDATTRAWLDEQLRERAAAVRALKKTVIYSGGLISPDVNLKLTTMLVRVCSLDWEHLETASVPVISKRERARRFSQRLLNAVSASIIPTTILVARLSVPAIRDFDKTGIVLVGTIVWLCLNLLSVFDPEYGLTKQGLNLLEKVPGIGKGGGKPGGAEE